MSAALKALVPWRAERRRALEGTVRDAVGLTIARFRERELAEHAAAAVNACAGLELRCDLPAGALTRLVRAAEHVAVLEFANEHEDAELHAALGALRFALARLRRSS